MKVKELMALLASCDAEASVVLATQPHYPLEHSVSGVTTRQECFEWSREASGETAEPRYDNDTAPGDVVLLEGRWLRYGHRDAWHAVRRGLR